MENLTILYPVIFGLISIFGLFLTKNKNSKIESHLKSIKNNFIGFQSTESNDSDISEKAKDIVWELEESLADIKEAVVQIGNNLFIKKLGQRGPEIIYFNLEPKISGFIKDNPNLLRHPDKIYEVVISMRMEKQSLERDPKDSIKIMNN